MTKDEAFIELLKTGVPPEEAKELLDAITREAKPIRPKKPEPEPVRHQPVWALMNRPSSIATGFKQMSESERSDNFDFNSWQDSWW
jgi:hypothetical protein